MTLFPAFHSRERETWTFKQAIFFYPRRLALLCHLTCELSPSLSFCFVCVGKTLKGPAHSRLYNASDPEGTSWEMNPFEMPADYILVERSTESLVCLFISRLVRFWCELDHGVVIILVVWDRLVLRMWRLHADRASAHISLCVKFLIIDASETVEYSYLYPTTPLVRIFLQSCNFVLAGGLWTWWSRYTLSHQSSISLSVFHRHLFFFFLPQLQQPHKFSASKKLHISGFFSSSKPSLRP